MILEEEAESLMEVGISQLPASKERLDDYRQAQSEDIVCSTLINYCRHGWPDKSRAEQMVKPFWEHRGELTVHNDLLLYGCRIVIPKPLQKEVLQKIHKGHQGIQRCRLRAKQAVW